MIGSKNLAVSHYHFSQQVRTFVCVFFIILFCCQPVTKESNNFKFLLRRDLQDRSRDWVKSVYTLMKIIFTFQFREKLSNIMYLADITTTI